MDDALTIDGRVAIVTGAGNGLGRAESLALARAGARLVLNDLPGDAVQAVAAEIAAAGGQAVVAAGDVAEWSTGERLLATALERVRAAGHPGQQRRGAARPDGVHDVRAGVGPGHPGAPARALRDHPAGHRLLAGAAERGRRPGVRADREHLVRGVPARLGRPAQLRRGQGRHRRPHRDDRASLLAVRRPRQRHLPPRPHRHDGRADGPGAVRTASTRSRRSTSRRWWCTWPARRPRRSTARCSWCTAAWPR